MEAKVHEATNNEAWGASSTLMQEIAQGTFNFQYFNEIMPTIYQRFTEKEAKQWRQIYKSLVLLEYLIKNGSERVVDDARSHISMIKMMKNFHYIDDKGKDQGINVRNRAKELAELLADVDLIKAERKKAKKNRNKYTGVGSEGGMMYSGSSRYEGFGSDYGSSNSADFYDEERPSRYDDETSNSSDSTSKQNQNKSIKKEEIKKPKTAKEMNLFDLDDKVTVQSTNKNDDDWGDFTIGNEDDDFDDFVSATQSNNVPPKPPHQTPQKSQDIFDLLGEENTFTTPSDPIRKSQGRDLMLSQAFDTLTVSKSTEQLTTKQPTTVNQTTTTTTAIASDTSPIGGIWSQASNLISLDSLGTKSTTTKKPQGPSMNSLKNASINAEWNNWANNSNNNSSNGPIRQQQQQQIKKSSAFDDLLL
ncbi:uncharacterized protein BX663DRAFT_524775 [Cokeromyces recurvatus]|uniref:uncharacterized protein n=1 Tax=Cokeromyces recurvatus TaxID=90255 RepID=UPI00221F83B8|nr:uncharacterized protein BX663DRAFT_524775 [Cokeromyces recurvatus]KAI7898453.1 hypothetical protein BX663DRAFT_524775 [Cokeromyces recurvatus]